MDSRTTSYAQALFAVARAEGNLGEVEDEFFRFAKVYESSDDLRKALTDTYLPVSKRQQIVEDLLGGKASQTTVALVSMIIGTGRAKEIPAIASALVEMSAEEAKRAVAEVRSVIELTTDQRERLAAALEKATGKKVEIKVVIDPSVKGGLVTTIGDTVLDGSVRRRLEQLRTAI